MVCTCILALMTSIGLVIQAAVAPASGAHIHRIGSLGTASGSRRVSFSENSHQIRPNNNKHKTYGVLSVNIMHF